MGEHEYLNSFINNSSTIIEKAGADIINPAHKAVMYDDKGDVVTAVSGEKAVGVVLSGAPSAVVKGETLNILIKDIGLIEAGGEIFKGDAVTVNEKGQGVKAEAGSFIFGFAFSTAAEGELIQVQINKAGKTA